MNQDKQLNSKGQFGTRFGFLMSAIGSAVGLGNLWGFPYKMGAYGGFAFLVLYLILVIFVGYVIMLTASLPFSPRRAFRLRHPGREAPIRPDARQRIGFVHIRSRQLIPFMMQDFRQRAHARPPNSNKMDMFFIV